MESNTSVFFLEDRDIITITHPDIDKLKKAAAEASLRRSRCCLHQSHDDNVQEMVIAFCQDSNVPIHRHRNKSESFHIIEGKLEILFYDDQGNITERIEMGTFGTGLPFLYRLSSDKWHTVKPLSDFVVIHETTSGPFIKEDVDILVT